MVKKAHLQNLYIFIFLFKSRAKITVRNAKNCSRNLHSSKNYQMRVSFVNFDSYSTLLVAVKTRQRFQKAKFDLKLV